MRDGHVPLRCSPRQPETRGHAVGDELVPRRVPGALQQLRECARRATLGPRRDPLPGGQHLDQRVVVQVRQLERRQLRGKLRPGRSSQPRDQHRPRVLVRALTSSGAIGVGLKSVEDPPKRVLDSRSEVGGAWVGRAGARCRRGTPR